MKKQLILALVLLVSLTTAPKANAAPKTAIVSAAFKTILSSATDSLEVLEQKYESDVSALDDALSSMTKAADTTLAQEIQAATDLYGPQIAGANQRLESAKVTFAANSELKIQQSLYTWQNADHVYSLLICPDTTLPAGPGWMEIAKRDCANENNKPRPGDISTKTTSKNTVGGEDWQPGDIAKVSLNNSANKDLLFAVANGYLIPLNPSLFDSSRLAISAETGNVADLIQKQGRARSAAQTKRDNSVAVAIKTRSDSIANLDDALETAKADLEAQKTAANLALLASKRASKDPSNFDAAFAVAYKFEYNRQMVGEIADAAWTGDWTYRSINSILKVNKLAVIGDSIGEKYSMTAAKSFNNSVGNAFVNEPDFRSALKVITSIYKKATSATLKF